MDLGRGAAELCGPPAKIGRFDLENEWILEFRESSTSEESDDAESAYSFQGYVTASAKDSGDESSSSESSHHEEAQDVYETEYEIATELSGNELTSNELCQTSSDDESSSSLINIMLPGKGDVKEEVGESSHGDTDDNTVEEVIIRKTPVVFENRKDKWNCIRCHVLNEWPWRYCAKCYRLRKGWLPDRPKPQKKKPERGTRKGLSEKHTDSGIGSQDSLTTVPSSFDSLNDLSDLSGWKSNKEDSLFANGDNDMCERCFRNPADGLFLHGRTAHQIYCYNCCKSVWKKEKGCPVCHRTTKKVVKVFQSFQ